jgi:hypothetical protein
MGRRGRSQPIGRQITVTVGNTTEVFVLDRERLPNRMDAFRKAKALNPAAVRLLQMAQEMSNEFLPDCELSLARLTQLDDADPLNLPSSLDAGPPDEFARQFSGYPTHLLDSQWAPESHERIQTWDDQFGLQ